jgi:hypothetical protein
MKLPFLNPSRAPTVPVLAAFLLGVLSASADPGDTGRTGGWKLQPAPKPWLAEGFAESLDLSGLASVDGRHCLVASDELVAVQVGRIDHGTGRLAAGAMVPLSGATGKKRRRSTSKQWPLILKAAHIT